MEDKPTIDVIRKAHARIKPFIHRTTVLTNNTIDKLTFASVFFKCENFQKTGSFKMRGAANAVLSLSEEQAKNGVITHSSGNFAAALSMAARNRGIPAQVVMPRTTLAIKKSAVSSLGASISLCEPTLEARENGVAQLIERTQAELIHPYNDHRIIAGQGTAALELMEDVPNLDAVIAPVGGGGLISGTAIAVRSMSSSTEVFAAEPANADDAARSFRENRIVPSINPNTICDGLRTSLGSLTFPIIKEHVKDIITVGETQIIEAMRIIMERMKIVIEPSSAVPLAAVLAYPKLFKKKRIGIILSGGNVDLNALPWKESM